MLLGLPWPAMFLRALLNDWYLRTRSRHEVAAWVVPLSAEATLVCPATPAQATTVATTTQNRRIPAAAVRRRSLLISTSQFDRAQCLGVSSRWGRNRIMARPVAVISESVMV